MNRRVCVNCEEEFLVNPKQIRADLCPSCHLALGIKEKVDRVGGSMIYEHKTAPTIQLFPTIRKAARFERSKRFQFGNPRARKGGD